MKRLVTLVLVCVLSVGLLPPAGEAQKTSQVRVLRAKDPATGKWYQRLDSSPTKAEAAFKTEVATQFGVAESAVTVVVTDWTETQRQTAVQELAAGTHEGAAVTAATVTVLKRPRDLRGGFSTIFAGTAAQQRDRYIAVLKKSPPLAGVVAWLGDSSLTAEQEALLTAIFADVKTKIGGGADEVLTQTEYDALKTLATSYGLGALVP